MDSDRRKHDRVGLAIPVRVQGFLAKGETWEEISTTTDVSLRGASFSLNHPLELGHVLLLSLGMPKRLRHYDTTDSTYRVYSLVRFVQRRSGRARVGVLFFGKYPPRGFHEHPDGRYLLPGDPMHKAPAASEASRSHTPPPDPTPERPVAAAPPATAATPVTTAAAPPPDAAQSAASATPADPVDDLPGTPAAPVPGAPAPEFLPSAGSGVERRSAQRVDVFVNFVLQLTDAQGAVLQQELTVADNIGRGGARVMTALPFQVGDVVLLQEAGGAFATRAEIRDVTRVQPAFERLHLRFVDRQAPDRLLR
jgi:hypothetical protein